MGRFSARGSMAPGVDAQIPWVLLIRREKLDGPRPYFILWLVGFAFWLAVLHWLRLPYWATAFGWLALSFYFAFYLPLFIALGRTAVNQLRVPVILAAPVIWTGLELARAHSDRHDHGQPSPYPVSMGWINPNQRPGGRVRRKFCGDVRGGLPCPGCPAKMPPDRSARFSRPRRFWPRFWLMATRGPPIMKPRRGKDRPDSRISRFAIRQ